MSGSGSHSWFLYWPASVIRLTVGGGETETERLEGNKSEEKKEKIREKKRIARPPITLIFAYSIFICQWKPWCENHLPS